MNALTQRRGYVHILPRPPPLARKKSERAAGEFFPVAQVHAGVAESGIGVCRYDVTDELQNAREESAMLEFATFYCHCLRRAFPGAWAAAWIASAALGIIGSSIAIFWAPFGTAMNYLVGLLPLTIFLAIMIGGPLVAAFLINRELEQQIATLNTQLSKRKSEEEIRQEQKQKYEKQIDRLRTEEIAAVRRMLKKGKMTSQDFKQCSEEEKVDYVDTAHLMTELPSVRRDPADASCSIDPAARDLIAEILDP